MSVKKTRKNQTANKTPYVTSFRPLWHEASSDVYGNKHNSGAAEIARNGKHIDWKYWAERYNITPEQGAKLAYFIDPIEWPDNTYAHGPIPLHLLKKIQRLSQWLAERNQAWDLLSLENVLREIGFPYRAQEAMLSMEARINEDKSSDSRPPQQQDFQEQQILRVIGELGYTANELPKFKPGKKWVKHEVRQRLQLSPKVFDKAWERLRQSKRIRELD